MFAEYDYLWQNYKMVLPKISWIRSTYLRNANIIKGLAHSIDYLITLQGKMLLLLHFKGKETQKRLTILL